MKVTESSYYKGEGVVIFKCTGRLVLGDGDRTIYDVVTNAVNVRDYCEIVLDLSGITKIDGSGVGELLSAQVTVINRGHPAGLRLLGLGESLREVHHITRIMTTFPVFMTEAAAVANFY